MSDREHHFETITPEISEVILKLHEEHPRLGHGGLLHLLTDAGYDVDSHELKIFCKNKNIKGDRWTWKSRLFNRRFWPYWTGGQGL